MARLAALALAAVVLAGAHAARADVVAPSTDDCTVDKQCKDGQSCPTLGGIIDADCAKDMATKGLALKCQQQKATVARAVYCPQAKSRCGKSSVAPEPAGGVAPTLLVLGLVAVALRRARSRR
jgi:MYXO-CTERM domain-containing protein